MFNIIVRVIYNVIHKDYKVTEYPEKLPEGVRPFIRNDRKKWKNYKFYIGGIFFIPIRCVLIIGSLALLTLMLNIIGAYKLDSHKESKVRRALVKFFVRCTATTVYLASGFRINYIKKKSKIMTAITQIIMFNLPN